VRLVLLAAVAYLFSSGCAATGLSRHAEIAATTANVIDAAGAMIEHEAASDWALLEAAAKTSSSPEKLAADQAKLAVTFAPIEAAYGHLCVAQAAYVSAIRAAKAAGQKDLSSGPVSALESAWKDLTQLGDAVGVHVPPLPAAVTDFLGGSK
jgi:hypothetical protein